MFYFFCQCHGSPPTLPPFPTRRSSDLAAPLVQHFQSCSGPAQRAADREDIARAGAAAQQRLAVGHHPVRSEEHTSELQSRGHLVCRLLLEKKKADVIEQIPFFTSIVRL